MKKHLTLLILVFSFLTQSLLMAQDYGDDVYYNSKDIETDRANKRGLFEGYYTSQNTYFVNSDNNTCVNSDNNGGDYLDYPYDYPYENEYSLLLRRFYNNPNWGYYDNYSINSYWYGNSYNWGTFWRPTLTIFINTPYTYGNWNHYMYWMYWNPYMYCNWNNHNNNYFNGHNNGHNNYYYGQRSTRIQPDPLKLGRPVQPTFYQNERVVLDNNNKDKSLPNNRVNRFEKGEYMKGPNVSKEKGGNPIPGILPNNPRPLYEKDGNSPSNSRSVPNSSNRDNRGGRVGGR